MSLFRPEVVENQRRRLYGEVTVHQPISFALLTGLAVFGCLAGGAYLATASVPRKETVSGWISPAAGLAQVYAQRGGVATNVSVAQGEIVHQGQALATLTLDVAGPNGSLVDRQRTQVEARIGEIDTQIAQAAERTMREQRRLRDRASALRTDIDQLRSQQSRQEAQLKLARQQLERIEPLFQKGFISAVDHDQRLSSITQQEIVVAEVERQIGSRLSDVADSEAQLRELPTSAASEASQLRASRSQLVQSMTELEVQGSNIVRSPISGRVAAVNLRSGETATPSTPVFSISPVGGDLQAELLIPTRSAGFVAKGQQVRIMVDAFPFQRFGTLLGELGDVSRASLNPGQIAVPVDFKEPVYRSTVRLSAATIMAYGQHRALQPGMSVKADVVTDRRTFLQWLLDPLLAARQRLT